MRVINHFTIRRTALCGQHVLFLTAQRCFDDGWQSSVSRSCLLTLVIGGNISEPLGMSECPNYEGGVSKDGGSLPFSSKMPCASASPVKCLQSLCSQGHVSSGRGEEKRKHQLDMAPCTSSSLHLEGVIATV